MLVNIKENQLSDSFSVRLCQLIILYIISMPLQNFQVMIFIYVLFLIYLNIVTISFLISLVKRANLKIFARALRTFRICRLRSPRNPAFGTTISDSSAFVWIFPLLSKIYVLYLVMNACYMLISTLYLPWTNPIVPAITLIMRFILTATSIAASLWLQVKKFLTVCKHNNNNNIRQYHILCSDAKASI